MTKNKKQKKNPWIAAILNVVVIGLGYLYIGKRTTFGLALVLADIISIIIFFTGSQVNAESFSGPLPVLSTLLFMGAFAYDAYQEAKG